VIRSASDLNGIQTRKNRLTLRGAVGVWNCESGDRIKGCDGTCIRAVDSLAGVGGWSITNVAAFSICRRNPSETGLFSPSLVFNINCG
jgi:hypothetical protein